MLKQIGSNVYVIEFPPEYGIGSKFIEDLVTYKGLTTIPNDPFIEPSPTPTTSFTLDTIHKTSHTHINNLLLLFGMIELFSSVIEQFSVSWFDSKDDQS